MAVRFGKSVLVRILCTCALTVARLMKSLAAIFLLEKPLVIIATISRSRWVSAAMRGSRFAEDEAGTRKTIISCPSSRDASKSTVTAMPLGRQEGIDRSSLIGMAHRGEAWIVLTIRRNADKAF